MMVRGAVYVAIPARSEMGLKRGFGPHQPGFRRLKRGLATGVKRHSDLGFLVDRSACLSRA